MQAAVLDKTPGKLEIQEVRTDSVGPNEVLVRVVAAGLCHSDLHVLERPSVQNPSILGHEGAGVVEEVGEQVVDFKVGDHVIGYPNSYCGKCEQCLTGHASMCDNRRLFQRPEDQRARVTTRDGRRLGQSSNLGTFAEYMLVHENGLVKMPNAMPFEQAAPLGCGISTGLGAALRTAQVTPGTTVAVIGCGGVGLGALQGARIAGAAKIIAVDVVPYKLEMAKKLGATDVVNASGVDPVQAVRDLTGGKGVHYSFEAIGMKKTGEQAFRMLRNGGTATMIGAAAGVKLEVDAYDLLWEKKLQGTNLGSTTVIDIQRYVDLYLSGRLNVDDMISRRIKLDEVNEGFHAMKAGEVIRSVIVFPN